MHINNVLKYSLKKIIIYVYRKKSINKMFVENVFFYIQKTYIYSCVAVKKIILATCQCAFCISNSAFENCNNSKFKQFFYTIIISLSYNMRNTYVVITGSPCTTRDNENQKIIIQCLIHYFMLFEDSLLIQFHLKWISLQGVYVF